MTRRQRIIREDRTLGREQQISAEEATRLAGSSAVRPSSGTGAVRPPLEQPLEGHTAYRPGPVAPRITKGAASVIFCYYGDSIYTTLFQETMKLKLAMEDYAYKVLLKHDNLPSFFDFSEKDEKLADQVLIPTQDNLVNTMIDLAQDGYMIDLYIFSHGWDGQFRVSLGTYGNNGTLTNAEIESSFTSEKTGLTQMPIRMVYGVNCYGKTMAPSWRNVGAKVTAGARYVNFYPNEAPKFMREWNKGNVTFEDAVRNSDTASARTVVQTYISAIHAPSTKKQWGGCPFGRFVLGDHDCARDYFVDQWLAADEWQKNESGKENMNYSSRMFVGGERDLTKNQTPRWD